jgi:hypothetical protein
LKNILRIAGSILMMVAASFAGVTVYSPLSGANVGSPVHVVATGSIGGTVTAMQIYDNGALKYQVKSTKIDTYVAMGAGTHYVSVKIWNSAGQSAVQSNTIKVGTSSASTGSTSSTAVPSTAKVYGNIDQMTGWQHCTTCAGAGGSGPTAPYSFTQFRTSPAMDGKAMQFWLGGTTPYANALWWKQLGANSGVSHFVYDLYFYYTDAAAPQALEFDLNQSVGGKKYIMGTQCSPRGSHTWDVWDNINAKWVSTGVGCSAPPTYKWNHLIWEIERVNGQVHYIAVTLNGAKHYINRYYAARSSGASELNVAFQMDGNYQQKDFSVWLDKVTLKAW